MPDEPRFALSRLFRSLAAKSVDFVVIGGVAVVVQANPRFTKDLDIAYALDEPNLTRLGEALIDLGACLRGIEEDLPFVPDARTLKQTENLTLTTPDGDIDLLARPPGSPEYETLRNRARTIDFDGIEVRVASIEDLMAMKRSAGRPQDLIDLDALQIALEQGEES